MRAENFIAFSLWIVALVSTANAQEMDKSVGRLWGFYYGVQIIQTECTRAYPNRKVEFDENIESWMSRNKPTVDKAMSVFEQRLRQFSRSEVEYSEVQVFLEREIGKLKLFAYSQVLEKIRVNQEKYCTETIGRLGAGKAELADLFLPDLHSLGID